MCGICGFSNIGHHGDSPTVLSAMTACLAHRGPDGAGTWLSPELDVGLGHTRLAIIDLAGGRQPIQSADGRFVIVFNGELYNFRSLRKDLEDLGHRFRTSSDTEVLLESYIRWGPACLQRFRGMFALAIYDTQEHEFFLARDRTGIKPLYYHWGPSGFLFGSEIKAILQAPGVPRRLDYQALADFLVLGYPLAPKTMFLDVRELEPGTSLRVSRQGIEKRRFWSWLQFPSNMGESEALEQTQAALTESLREHLVSDVPIGVLLSGGIDSSLLVAFLAKVLGEDLETFTVSFTEGAYDESPYAEAVARSLGVRHRKIVLDPRLADISLIENILVQFDQPFADSSAIPTYFICKEIRKSAKVAIGGDGGDEMFGGYRRFYHADLAKLAGTLPNGFLKATSATLGGISGIAPHLSRMGKRFLCSAASRNEGRLLALSCYTFPYELPEMIEPCIMKTIGNYVPSMSLNGHGTSNPGGKEFVDSTVRYALPGDYLRKVDVMSAAHGLEVRVPFLGEHVLECAAKIPLHLKYSRKKNKIILRKLAEKYLPKAIVEKPKGGFGIPLDSWLGRNGREEVRSLLNSRGTGIRDVIRPEYSEQLLSGFVDQIWNRSKRSRFNTYQQVYMLWSLERWLARWKPAL
ncbi:MAG: asparagine synthase (glutamine-hydrolyzing) [Acidobacteria bacterium]|nr:MAG: asparagine synthase (glutamine-hydrolyzing) [Acidobacteriota bacterium]